METPEYCKIWLFIWLESQQQRQEAIVICKFKGGGGNWELGTCDGNWEQPTNFCRLPAIEDKCLVQQAFGGAC